MNEARAPADLTRVMPLVRRCRAAAARGDADAAWGAFPPAAWRATADMVGAHAPGEPPRGRVVHQRAAPAASAQLAAPDPQEGRLRRREAALATLLQAQRAGGPTDALFRAAIHAVDAPDAVRLRGS